MRSLGEQNRKVRRGVYAEEDRARRTGQWAAWEKLDVRGLAPGDGWASQVHTVYRNGWCIVQIRTLATAFGQVEHLIIRTAKEAELGWREKQRVKAELLGPERVAVEIYPAASATVDAANLYHLWVLPEGMRMPFGLHASDPAAPPSGFGVAEFRAVGGHRHG